MGNSTVEENYQKGVCSHIFSKPETPSQLPSSLSGILLIILRLSIIFSTHPTTQISSNSYYENLNGISQTGEHLLSQQPKWRRTLANKN